ncbi:MAG TPA: LysR family transcriptional regulator [Anaerolineales bacterium]|nr:LysR family transcriptional regulator [Anaerolineales bacterium]
MELYQLTTFRTIAALGSFSQAAELLGYAQSTISEHIKSLETELQTRLFKRAGSKRVALTPAGEALLKYAQKMSNLEEEIKVEVNQPAEPQGTLSVRVPETVSIHFLPPVLKRFRAQFPKVNLDFMNCVYFDLPEELKAGVVDLGFLIIDTFQTTSLATETLRPIPLVMVAHPAHPLAAGAPIDASQLKGEPLIVPANDCSYVQMLDRILLEQKVKLSLVWRFNSIGAIKQVLASGIGVSILPEVAVQSELANGSLAVLPWHEGGITANLLMIWQKNKWQPPVLQAFMEMAREGLVL